MLKADLGTFLSGPTAPESTFHVAIKLPALES